MAVRQATAQLLHVQLYLQPRPLCQGLLSGTIIQTRDWVQGYMPAGVSALQTDRQDEMDCCTI